MILHVKLIPQAQVICLIVHTSPRAAGPNGERVYISGKAQVPMV